MITECSISLKVFTITNKDEVVVELLHNGTVIAKLEPGKTSDHLTETGEYQVLKYPPIWRVPRVLLLEVIVTSPVDALDKTYTTTRKDGKFSVEIDFER
jgi:hypothetical protein